MSGNKISSIHADTFIHNSELLLLDLNGNSITDVHPLTFGNNSRLKGLNISGNKIDSIHSDTFTNNTDLEWLHLKGNRIWYVHPSTFQKNIRLWHLDMSGNILTAVDLHTFSCNSELHWLDLQKNKISDIHPSTFRNNNKIEYLDLSTNSLTVIHSDTFQQNVNLKFLSLGNNKIHDIINTGFLSGINPTYLDLSGNEISYVNSSVFRKQGQLETLILSDNMLQILEPGIFGDCTNLRYLSLSANNISEISRYAFYGLEHLENLDFSNNNIGGINPIWFEFLSINPKRHKHQVYNLKHLNLAQNKIRSFNFELCFPSNTNSVTSDPTYQLVSLNVSSNLLDSLDAPSVRWLKHTAAVTDLSGNPWKCQCSALGEAWRELRHRLTLECASPEDKRGRTWDVLEGDSCTDRIRYVELPCSDKLNESSRANTNITKDTDPALSTTMLVVNGVLLACTLIGAGFIAVQLVKKLKKRTELPERNGAAIALTETGSLLRVSSRLSLRSVDRTGHVYETLQQTGSS
jgi:Leucine-rich repeat (LRR) protein